MSSKLREMIRLLNQAHLNFIQVAHQLHPKQQYQAGVCGEWSPKDVVAHLIGWDTSLKRFILDTENFEPPEDVHLFNSVSVISRTQLSWDEVMHELETNFLELTQAMLTIEPQMKIYARVTGWIYGRIEDYAVHKSQLAVWLL